MEALITEELAVLNWLQGRWSDFEAGQERTSTLFTELGLAGQFERLEIRMKRLQDAQAPRTGSIV